MILLNAFISIGRDVTHVDVELVPCTKVSLNIFDPIFSSEIVHPSGHIAKCFHEVHLDFDELRMVSMQCLNHFRSHYDCWPPCKAQYIVYLLVCIRCFLKRSLITITWSVHVTVRSSCLGCLSTSYWVVKSASMRTSSVPTLKLQKQCIKIWWGKSVSNYYTQNITHLKSHVKNEAASVAKDLDLNNSSISIIHRAVEFSFGQKVSINFQ